MKVNNIEMTELKMKTNQHYCEILKLTDISVEGWSINIISDSSPSRRTDTVLSPNSSSARKHH